MKYIFFDGWQGIIRVLVTTIVAYFLFILILRISGKRTLAKMNAFDFVVTIALGSILGAIILNKKIPLVEGILAVIILIALQYSITFISVRNKSFKKFISSNPTLLLFKGEMLHEAMRKERVTESEILKAARDAGIGNLSKVEAVVIESTGDLTIIKTIDKLSETTLRDVGNFPHSTQEYAEREKKTKV